MKANNILIAVMLATSGVCVANTPAYAGLFDDAVHLAKGAANDVVGAGKKVEHAVVHETKAVVHTVAKAAKTVGHATASVARDVGRTASKAPAVYMAVAKPVGGVLAKYYHTAGTVLDHTPVLKGFAPLARDAARAAVSREGKVGAFVGAAVAVGSGGLGALRYVGTAAGAGAMAGYYGKKGGERGVYIARRASAEVRWAAKDVSSSIRDNYRGIRSSMR